MKPCRKIVNMDYRGQTAKTYGIFADPYWPRDDETQPSEYYRGEKRTAWGKSKASNDMEDKAFDPVSLLDRTFNTTGRDLQ